MNKRTIYAFLSAILSWSLVRHSVLIIDSMSYAILEGSRGSPFQYRMLWPHIYVALVELVHEPHIVTWMLWLLLFALVAIALDEYCRYWFDEQVVWGWVVVTMAILAGTPLRVGV